MNNSLRNTNILVTRPAHQAKGLCELIESHQGTPILFPCIEIIPISDQKSVRTEIQSLHQSDLVIFTSPNSVLFSKNLIDASLAQQLTIIAIGPGTKKELEAAGFTVHHIPEKSFNSEGLLALDVTQNIKDKHITIVRGKGGRELLAKTLSERGAILNHVIVYERIKPNIDPSHIINQLQNRQIDIIIATSNEGLNNLVELIGPKAQTQLQRTPLLVVSQRLLQQVEELGFTQTPTLAENASDEKILAALIQWKDMHYGKSAQRKTTITNTSTKGH